MKNENGTPVTMTLEQERVDRLARLSPKRTVPTAALLRAYAEIDALRDAVHALTAKAAALDALVEAMELATGDMHTIVAQVQRGQKLNVSTLGLWAAQANIALSAAKAAQVSK